MTTLDPTQSYPDPDPTATPGMRSVGTNNDDGEGLTIFFAVTPEEVYFSGSILRSDLRALLDQSIQEAQVENQEEDDELCTHPFLELARNALLGSSQNEACNIDCKLTLTLEIQGEKFDLKTQVQGLKPRRHNELLTRHRDCIRRMRHPKSVKA